MIITREKLEELRKLVELSGDRFDFGGLPMPAISDTLNALWRVAEVAKKTIDEQAEDEALWSTHISGTQPIAEAYLQQELRKLHSVIEDALAGLKDNP